MKRIVAALFALKGFLVVVETGINFVLGILDTVTDVAQAVANPEHKTLAQKNEGNSRLSPPK